jgi:hypothetical protein
MVGSVEERLGSLETRLRHVEARVAALAQPRIGLTADEARARAQGPAERTPETMAKLRRIFGRFDGPEDLSARFRDYLAASRT